MLRDLSDCAMKDACGMRNSSHEFDANSVHWNRRWTNDSVDNGRRRGGGGRPLRETDPGLLAALEELIEPATRGDPQSPLRWTCKSTRRLAEELPRQSHPVAPRSVAALLREAGYSLQANRKTREGASHPDRNAQFEYINARVERCLKRGQPAISVDPKKKELG